MLKAHAITVSYTLAVQVPVIQEVEHQDDAQHAHPSRRQAYSPMWPQGLEQDLLRVQNPSSLHFYNSYDAACVPSTP